MSPSTEPLLAVDPRAVDHRAVRRAEVDDDVRPLAGADLGVAAADVRVGERHRAVGEPADADRPVAERDALARRQHERAGADAARRLPQLATTPNRPRLELVVGGELDAHRADEVVPLLTGVLAGRLDELGLEHVVDVGEARRGRAG